GLIHLPFRKMRSWRPGIEPTAVAPPIAVDAACPRVVLPSVITVISGYQFREVFGPSQSRKFFRSWPDRLKRGSWSSFAARIYSGSRSNVSRGRRDRFRLWRGNAVAPASPSSARGRFVHGVGLRSRNE